MNARLAQNPNLTLHTKPDYNGNSVYLKRGPSIDSYLTNIDETLKKALFEHPRTIAIRTDLRLPLNFDRNDTCVISRFMESLKAQIRADLNNRARRGVRVHDTTLRYIWVKEQNKSMNWHYHVVLLLNNDTYNHLGNFNAQEGNMAARIKKAWISALGLCTYAYGGLVHFPKNPIHYVNVNSKTYIQEYDTLFYRVSYFAKADTKKFGNGTNSFGCSRK